MVVNRHVGAGHQTLVLWRRTSAFNHWAVSLAPHVHSYFSCYCWFCLSLLSEAVHTRAGTALLPTESITLECRVLLLWGQPARCECGLSLLSLNWSCHMPWLAWNFWQSSGPGFPNMKITGMCHHTQLRLRLKAIYVNSWFSCSDIGNSLVLFCCVFRKN